MKDLKNSILFNQEWLNKLFIEGQENLIPTLIHKQYKSSKYSELDKLEERITNKFNEFNNNIGKIRPHR